MLTAEKEKLLPEIEKALNQVNFLCESIKDTEIKMMMLIKALIEDKPQEASSQKQEVK